MICERTTCNNPVVGRLGKRFCSKKCQLIAANASFVVIPNASMRYTFIIEMQLRKNFKSAMVNHEHGRV